MKKRISTLIAVFVLVLSLAAFSPSHASAADPYVYKTEKINSPFELARLQADPDETFFVSVWFCKPADHNARVSALSETMPHREAVKEVTLSENRAYLAQVPADGMEIRYVCNYAPIVDMRATYQAILNLSEAAFVASIWIEDPELRIWEDPITGMPVDEPNDPPALPHGCDINQNGVIDAADARQILRFSVKLDMPTAQQFPLADVDADGIITAADARIALRSAVGL